jgi:hypothetical protein
MTRIPTTDRRIVHSIMAQVERETARKTPTHLSPMTQDTFVECIEDHYRNAMLCAEEGGPEAFSIEAGREWYLSMMPMLTSRRSVQLYIALTAYGRQTNLLSAEDAKRCLYVAQLALAAFGTASEGPEARLLREANRR